MHLLKKFIKSKGHADSYEGLKINFIPGASPVLICFNDETEIERVDLTKAQVTEQLHKLVQQRGFKKKAKEEL